MERLIIKNSRWKHQLLLIGCIGFVLVGVWLVGNGKPLGWLGILFFGSGIPISIWQLVDSRPRLIIDEHGVIDRTLGVGCIAWSDIELAYVMSISGNDFICLELKNPEKYLQKLSKVKRAMAAANRSLGFTDFNLNLSGVEAKTDEIFELLMKYCRIAAETQPDYSLNKKKAPTETPTKSVPYGLLWLEAVKARFGELTTIRKVQYPDKPTIYVFHFDDLPEKGFVTAITSGLAEAGHPDWKLCAPELIITMKSSDHSWGFPAAYFASRFFGESPFSYGEVFKLDHPISDESEMNACLLYLPSFPAPEQSKFVLPDRTVRLVGLYPIYDDEIEIYNRVGLNAFWHADGFKPDNPKRGRVTIPQGNHMPANPIPANFSRYAPLVLASKQVCGPNRQSVRLAFRIKPNNEADSGWVFHSGYEDQDFNDDPSNTLICPLLSFINTDCTLLDILQQPVLTAWERDHVGGEWREITDYFPF